MHFITCFWAILYIALSQTCCDDFSHCPTGSLCLCEEGINTCVEEISQQNKTFSMTNSSVDYFYWTPSQDTYTTVKINICGVYASVAHLNIGFYVQDPPEGTGYPTKFSESASFSQSNCWIFTITQTEFPKTQNEAYCKLLIATQLTRVSKFEVTIKISTTKNYENVLMPILTATGIFLFILIIAIIIYVIRKNMKSNLEKPITHYLDLFDKYIPRIPLMQLIQAKNIGDSVHNCGICLSDIQLAQPVRKIPCNHIFHANCLDGWCKIKLICPLCRECLGRQNLVKKEAEFGSSVELTNNPSENQQEGARSQTVLPLQNNQ